MVAESEHRGGMSIEFPLPVPAGDLFRHAATSDILNLLATNPRTAFAIRDIRRATGHSPSSVTDAVDLLAANGLVTIAHEGSRKLVQIDRDRLSNPNDPVLQIPQSEYHEPVAALVERVREDLPDVRGVVLFGSVARGEADRRSDIDCFVLVDEGQASAQQRAHEITAALEGERFDGDRYEFQVLVESTDTAGDYGDRLRDIFASGLTLVDSDALRRLRTEVLTDGRE